MASGDGARPAQPGAQEWGLAAGARRQLARVVQEARRVAESGTARAVQGLQAGVLPGTSRALALAERAEQWCHARWHRMLFGRFLAHNRLGGDADGAQGLDVARVLADLYPIHPELTGLQLPSGCQQRLDELLAEIPTETFRARDAFGWAYQFWQSSSKDEANATGGTSRVTDLPALTQLFSEPYMVLHLLHNTLGAWWAARVLRGRPTLAQEATSEQQLREACALPGCSWSYLRFVRRDGRWQPSAGGFERWPAHVRDLRVLDPCCGSGHFLVAALDILARLRACEEQLDLRVAVDLVLRDNLRGLELDPRCARHGAAALALAAWSFPGAGGLRALPRVPVACCGLAPEADQAAWRKVGGEDPALRAELGWLHGLFRQAPHLGSLLDPVSALRGTPPPELPDALRAAFALDFPPATLSLGADVVMELSGPGDAAATLCERFHLVATNVPYLGREKQHGGLRAFAEDHFPVAKQDLATVFLSRSLALSSPGGACAQVLPGYWLFLSSYMPFRNQLLRQQRWRSLVTLGAGAFESISGEVVNPCLVILERQAPEGDCDFTWQDLSEARAIADKAGALRGGNTEQLSQSDQCDNPDLIIGYKADHGLPLLNEFVYSYQGLATSDNAQFVFRFWEVPAGRPGWHPFHFAPGETRAVSGCGHILFYENGEGRYREHAMALRREGRLGGWKSGHEAWGRRGVAINRMGKLFASLYLGEKFDCNVAMLIPHDEAHLPAIWAYCSSPEYAAEVRRINRKVSVTNATLAKVPFDLEHWQQRAHQSEPAGLPSIARDDPTQWTCDGAVAPSNQPLQVAIARLLGYRWPAQDETDAPSVADETGILCLPSLAGEPTGAERLEQCLQDQIGAGWSGDMLAGWLAERGGQGHDLDWWLRHRFFARHCQIFEQRPFIWQIWDGLRVDGFSALLNYHRLDRANLELLIEGYLAAWIQQQQEEASRKVSGAIARVEAARRLSASLSLILEGERPHDIFVRWKPLEGQAIGWNPDLDDGVRVNIRPFMSVPDVDLGGAGILRCRPRIHWKHDRGVDSRDAPWYALAKQHGLSPGTRINDHHLPLAAKVECAPEPRAVLVTAGDGDRPGACE